MKYDNLYDLSQIKGISSVSEAKLEQLKHALCGILFNESDPKIDMERLANQFGLSVCYEKIDTHYTLNQKKNQIVINQFEYSEHKTFLVAEGIAEYLLGYNKAEILAWGVFETKKEAFDFFENTFDIQIGQMAKQLLLPRKLMLYQIKATCAYLDKAVGPYYDPENLDKYRIEDILKTAARHANISYNCYKLMSMQNKCFVEA